MIKINELDIDPIVKRAPEDYDPFGKYGIFELLGIKTQILNMNPLGIIHGDDCVVRAACILYQAAHGHTIEKDKALYDFLYQRLSSIGKRQFKLMNSNSVVKECLKEFNFEPVTFCHTLSLGTFLATHKFGYFLVGVDYHCFAYINGMIYDASQNMLGEISHMIGFPVEIVYCEKSKSNVIFHGEGN